MRKRIHLKINIIISMLFIMAFVFNYKIISQNASKPVAEVGNEIVTEDEFLFRYELTPQMFREQRNAGNSLKQEFLYTLIAEKLLADYGESTALDTADIVKYTLKTFEEMFVRDELYKRKVIDAAKYKADSLLSFYISNGSEAKFQYIITDIYDDADKIYQLLQKGAPFDFFSTDTSLSNGDTLTFTFGQIDELTENEILTLPENSSSKPIKLDNRWYVFHVVKKNNPIIEKKQGWETEYKRLSKLAKQRAEQIFYKNYMMDIFGRLSVKSNGKLLKIFADKVYDVLNMKINAADKKTHFLEIKDIVEISANLDSKTLNSTLAVLPLGSISLKDFINFFRFENISFDSIDYQLVLDALNGKTRKYIEYRILASEGYKLGLDKSTEVQKKLKMWKQNYFYQLVMTEFMDSAYVSEEDLKSYLNQMNKTNLALKKYNVIEAVVPDLEAAENLLNDLDKGIDFSESAMKYSVEKKSADSFESGLKPLSYFGEIGPALEKIKAGEVYGPLKVAKGYSIFKLVDVQEDTTFASISLDNKDLINELKYLKMKRALNEFIAKLASQSNISINTELLSSVKTTTHNSVVFELLGFGGKITAVPLISPNSEWVESWKNSLKVIP